MKIPFFSLERQYKKNKHLILNSIQNVLESQNFIGGPFVQEFEKKFTDYVSTKYTVSCNSGTDALWLSLKTLDLAKNSLVLTTPFSFIASSSEIVSLDAHPIFIDVDPETYNIAPEKIKIWLKNNAYKKNGQTLHKQTGFPVAGIITVDIFGQCTDHQKIKDITDEWNLWIIQDACQAVGAVDQNGKKAGTHGDISCFSFYPTKNLGAYGDAGCCTTSNKFLAEKLMQLRNHGRKSHYNYEQHGINSRLDGIQAAILRVKLNNLDKWNNKRRRIAEVYNQKLANLDFIKLPQEVNGKHVYHQYCIQVLPPLNRDQFAKELNKFGVGTNIYYPKTLNEIEFLNADKRFKTECPVAQNLTKTILALPIWPELELQEVEYICDKVLFMVRDTASQFLTTNGTNKKEKLLNN